jgi:hypothetical protein
MCNVYYHLSSLQKIFLHTEIKTAKGAEVEK